MDGTVLKLPPVWRAVRISDSGVVGARSISDSEVKMSSM